MPYTPAGEVYRRLGDALRVQPTSGPCEVVVDGGGPTVRTPGRILELSERGGAKCEVYGGECWFRARDVHDLGDGSLRIASSALVRGYPAALRRRWAAGQ